MAYDGGIDFLDLPLGRVHWVEGAIRSPWAPGGSETWHTGDGEESVEIRALANPLNLPKLSQGLTVSPDGNLIVFDNPGLMAIESRSLMCVVVGKSGNHLRMTEDETVHFVLIITIVRGFSDVIDGHQVYERVGVGRVKGKCLDLRSPSQYVWIR